MDSTDYTIETCLENESPYEINVDYALNVNVIIPEVGKFIQSMQGTSDL